MNYSAVQEQKHKEFTNSVFMHENSKNDSVQRFSQFLRIDRLSYADT